LEREARAVEGFGRQVKLEEDEIKERLKDYEETFESELPETRRKAIESFAKDIPREIVKTESMQSPFRKPEEIMELEKREMKSKAVDYNLINNIMNNKFSKDNSNNNNSGGIQNRSSFRGETRTQDNLDRFVIKKPENNEASNKPSSSSDRDVINKIITNRFGKGFVNDTQSKEEKK
jgi:hypothetical protein